MNLPPDIKGPRKKKAFPFPPKSKPVKSLVLNVVKPTRPMFVPILPNAEAAAD
ncbi:hypothetical protein N8619_02085 [Akkermansiaceae bacterium]|nr:hypothetical protein [Akkermansiaceae bacterium]